MTEWTARVEWTPPETYSIDAIDQLLVRLADWHAAIGRDSDVDGILETWTATLTVEANTLRQAFARALEVVEGVTGERATGAEVIDADVHSLRIEQPSIPELWGYVEIAEHFGVTRVRARQLADLPGFPVAVVETKAGPLRVRAQVEGWGQNWERKNGRPKKAAEATSATSSGRG